MTLADEVQSHFDLACSAYPQGELEFMVDTVAEVKPDAIFEWGTGSGASGRIFYEAGTLTLGRTINLFTVDLPDELAPLESQHPRERTGQYLPGGVHYGVTAMRGDGVTNRSHSLRAESGHH